MRQRLLAFTVFLEPNSQCLRAACTRAPSSELRSVAPPARNCVPPNPLEPCATHPAHGPRSSELHGTFITAQICAPIPTEPRDAFAVTMCLLMHQNHGEDNHCLPAPRDLISHQSHSESNGCWQQNHGKGNGASPWFSAPQPNGCLNSPCDFGSKTTATATAACFHRVFLVPKPRCRQRPLAVTMCFWHQAPKPS